MNKKILLIVFVPILFLFACNSLKIGDYDDINKELDFKVEKIQLTKSFQKIEPYAELRQNSNKKNPDIKLIISAGLFQSSGLEIEKIIRDNNDLNIYIDNISDHKSELAVPQGIVLLDKDDIDNIDNMKLNIINKNSKPIDLKIRFNDVLSITESQFKLNTIMTPEVILYQNNEDFIWNIHYNAVYDKSQDTIPLVSLDANIDGNTGKIIDYNKETISEVLDSGTIVGVFKDRYLVYKKLSNGDASNKENKEELWYFDSLTNEKFLLFSSDYQLSNTHLSPNSSYLSFIETTETGANLYIVPDGTKKPYKVSNEKNINPIFHSWIDNNTVCLVEHNKNKSLLFKYNVKTNDIEPFITLGKTISNLSIEKGKFLFLEEDEESINKDIYITSDFKDYSLIGKGSNPKFLNGNTIVYMEKKEKQEDTIINIYDLRNSEIKFEFEGLIPSYQIVDHNTVFYPIKAEKHNNFILNKYNYLDDSITEINKCITSKAFFNRRQNLYYINLNSPIENDINMMIYPIKIK